MDYHLDQRVKELEHELDELIQRINHLERHLEDAANMLQTYLTIGGGGGGKEPSAQA